MGWGFELVNIELQADEVCIHKSMRQPASGFILDV